MKAAGSPISARVRPWKRVLILMLSLGVAAPIAAQGLSQQQGDEILKELRGIREVLERMLQSAPTAQQPDGGQRVTLAVAGTDSILGRPDAPLTLVEFTDLQCPFCNRFALITLPELKKTYIDTGKLRFISRDFPLPMHAEAVRAARASRCAGEQKKFWDMRLTLVMNAGKLSRDFMMRTAAEIKLDTSAFGTCLDGDRYTAEVEKDARDGAAIGVQGTPSFILGRTGGAQMEGILIPGALPFSAFDEQIKALLAEPGVRQD